MTFAPTQGADALSPTVSKRRLAALFAAALGLVIVFAPASRRVMPCTTPPTTPATPSPSPATEGETSSMFHRVLLAGIAAEWSQASPSPCSSGAVTPLIVEAESYEVGTGGEAAAEENGALGRSPRARGSWSRAR